MTNEHKNTSKGSEQFNDYAEFEAYVLKRMANELEEKSIKATNEFLSKITEEHKDYLEGVRERCLEMRHQKKPL